MRALFAMSAAALAFAGAADAGPRQLSAEASETLSKYQPTGEVIDCLPLRQIDSMKVLEDRIILVETNSGAFYINQTPSDCNGARGNRRLQYRTSEPRLCRGQIIDIIDNHSGFPMGSCSLGGFERVVEKKQV